MITELLWAAGSILIIVVAVGWILSVLDPSED